MLYFGLFFFGFALGIVFARMSQPRLRISPPDVTPYNSWENKIGIAFAITFLTGIILLIIGTMPLFW